LKAEERRRDAGLKKIWGIRDLCRDFPFSPLFESCADFIAMMTLKRVVAFLSLTENLGRCANPNYLKWRC